MSDRLYPELKRKARVGEHLLPSEREFMARVEALIGYEIDTLMPLGSMLILGSDVAEAIVKRIDAARPMT